VELKGHYVKSIGAKSGLHGGCFKHWNSSKSIFDRGESTFFHWLDCCFVSGS
jgi:hypothetical protein